MSEPFDFDIDESWKAVAELFASVTNMDPSEMGGVSAMRRRWEQAKGRLLSVLGPNGRLVVDLGMYDDSLCEQDKEHAVKQAREYLNRKIGLEVRQSVHSLILDVFWYVVSHASVRELATSRLDSSRHDNRPGREGKRLEKGTKLGKYVESTAWKYFLAAYAKSLEQGVVKRVTQLVCEALSIATSCLSSRRGKLVLSVNPLEMLLASMYTTGWGSCHRLDGGEYCTGPVAYMLDNCTAIAYATSSNAPCDLAGDRVLPVKSWRQMVFFDLDAGSALMSRQYPGNSVATARVAREAVATVLARHHGVEQPRWYVKYFDGSCCGSDDPQASGYVYDDLYVGWHYRDPVDSRVRLRDIGKAPTVCPGVECLICPACGEDRDYGCKEDAEQANKLLCQYCRGDVTVCSICHSDITDPGYLCYTPQDEPVCEYCFSDNYDYCHDCGDVCRLLSLVEAVGECGSKIWICPSCAASSKYLCCCACDTLVHERLVVLDDVHGNAYCEGCAESVLLHCPECDRLVPADETFFISETVCVCRYCYHDCVESADEGVERSVS